MRYALPLLALLILGAGDAWAQDFGARESSLSVALIGGGFTPITEFGDGSKMSTGGTFGAALTFWPSREIGVRGSVLRSENAVDAPASTGLHGQDPTVWFYSGELLLRPEFYTLQRWGWSPYVLAGAGLKSYDFAVSTHIENANDFASLLGAGLEYRFGRFGLMTEARGIFSNFRHLGYDEKQRDLVYTAGVTVNF